MTDWAYALTARPKLDDFVKSELKSDPNRLGAATERAEAFAFEQIKQSAEQLFKEQFKRNIHAILLSTGERAQFEISMMQRLQVRFPTRKTSEAEIRQSVYVPQINSPELTSTSGRARWFLENEDVDERIERRFLSTDWGRFKSDVEEVVINVKLAQRPGSQESYTISSSRKGALRRITITAPSNQGLFYALSALEERGADGRLAEDFQLNETPSLAKRGVAETAQGSNWSHGDRLEILRFLGMIRMNRYIYGQRSDTWREDVSEEDRQKFIQLIKTAEENFVRVVFAVRPGSSFKYSDDEDSAALIRKLDEMIALGARGFALCFDNAPSVSQTSENNGRFKTVAAAQAQLVNMVHGRLKQTSPDIELYISPSSSASSSEYQREFGAAIPQDVLFFRSDDGANGQIREASASANANRRFVTWDNFADNDGQPWRLSMEAKRDASPGPGETANGFIVKAMSQSRASMIPIATAADYAWNPRNYNSKQSFDRALNLLYDERARAGLRVWAQNSSDNIFKPLFQKQAGVIEIVSTERKLAELQGAAEMMAVTLNQGLLRGELAAYIARARYAVKSLKNDPSYEKLPNGNYRLRGN